MKYQWDETKRSMNLRNHKIDFQIVEGFEWETAMIEADKREQYLEDRFGALGVIGNTLFFLVYTNRGDEVRVISLRKADSCEVKKYENQ
ncbi:MAG: BrnT family toxin [Candidatus Ozemobacteraceae bacterium]